MKPVNKIPSKQFSSSDVDILKRETRQKGFLEIQVLKLKCRLYQGGWSRPFQRELMLRAPGIGVLPYDPVRDQILMVEQFRIGCMEDILNGPWALELIAGIADAQEDVEEVAGREALEEAGVTISDLIPISEYYTSPGASSEKISVFCSLIDMGEVQEGIFGLPEENENIRSIILDRSAAETAVSEGRINNAMSIIAIQWLSLNLERLRNTKTSRSL